MKLIIDITDSMVCNDIQNKALEPQTETDKVIIDALYNGIPYEERPQVSNNAELFKQTFGIYATELWSMKEADFLKWLNAEVADEGLQERAVSDLHTAIDDTYKKLRGEE